MVILANIAGRVMPALLTRPCTAPKRFAACSTQLSPKPSSATLPSTGHAAMPPFRREWARESRSPEGPDAAAESRDLRRLWHAAGCPCRGRPPCRAAGGAGRRRLRALARQAGRMELDPLGDRRLRA